MKKFVVMSGGFHPFHAGHASLYQQAKEAFPDATVLVCATNVQSDRPFPFSLKKKLAQLSGVPPKDFIEVSRQFTIQDPALAKRIGNPDDAIVIYVRSDKDRNEPPMPWKLGPDGKPPVGKRGPKKGLPLSDYLLEYPSEGQPLEPASKHAYMAYLKTVEFGPGITSASEIRNTWPTLNDKRKLAMVMSLYPATKSNPKLAQNVVGMFDQVMGNELAEARTNPDQNTKPESGLKELQTVAKTISDPENWAISMTSEPKLGINPQVGISEDTPKGIYFYPLNYALDKTRYGKLPWGDNYPYIQLFQYDRSHEMTKQTKVDPARLKQALKQYCSDDIIQQAIDEPEYDGTPYWFIYDCLSRLGKSDETNVVRWNKVLRDLGFTSVYDDGAGWIAYNEPTQGVVLDPRVIKQLKTIVNKKQSGVVTPAAIEQTIFETMDMELARNRAWQAYDPDGSKLKAAAKEYAKDPKFKPYFGKPGTEEIFDKAEGMGRYGAARLSDEAWDWYKEQQAQKKVDEDKKVDPVTDAVISFYKPVVNDIHKEKLHDYVDQARELLHKTNDPEVRSKLVDIFKKGKENPYIQGGIVTTVGAVLAGGILTTAQKMGLSPAQTNLALQAILNTVIPTVVSRINGKNWSDTIKYTLASAGIGTGIAGASLIENDIPESIDYLEEK